MSDLKDYMQRMDNLKIGESYPPCTGCGNDVTSDSVSALALPYHRKCLVCTRCRVSLNQGEILEYKQRPHCTDCVAFFQGKKCAKCGEGVAHGKRALDRLWHPRCLQCAHCSQPLDGAFIEEQSRPYHEDCYRRLHDPSQKQQSSGEKSNAWRLMDEQMRHVCHSCRRDVDAGEGISVNGRGGERAYFHDGCFRCDGCRQPIRGQHVVSEEGGFFCNSCGDKKGSSSSSSSSSSSAPRCHACGRDVEGRYVKALGNAYCAGCFKCAKCRREFPGGSFVDVDGKPTCENCA